MEPSHSSNIQASAANELVHSENSFIQASEQEHAATGNNGNGMDLGVFNAAKHGNIVALRKYLKDDEDLSQILTPTNNTVLHIYIACATEKGQKSIEIVQEILAMSPPLLLQPNKNGDTALHTAATHGRNGLVELLIQAAKARQGDLENGSEEWRKLIRATNKEGDTALHHAVYFNRVHVVEILTTQDPEFSYAVNVAGETPLYLAAERGYTGLVIQILRTCTNPSYQGPNGRTALHAAVIRNDKEMTRKLLEKRSELTKAVDEQGCTPLHLAASFGRTSIVKELLKHDRTAAYVGDKDQKMTALHFAASKGHESVMKEIITQCPDCCELVDHKRRNLLHCAIDAGKWSFQVEDLVSKDPWLSNVLLNGKDDKGDTPLHRLAVCESLASSLLGTDARVDKMAFNKENRNAFDILLQVNNRQFYSSTTQGELKDKLKMNGVISGCRIVSNKDVNNTKSDEKGSDTYSKAKDAHVVVATLIATVSFAAGFTMPGGYQDDKGQDPGFTVLTRYAAFQAFVITNTIAMTLSSCSVLFYLYLSAITKQNQKVITEAFTFAYFFTMLALISMVIAFITGTYAVLSYSSALSIVVCVLGCVIFFGLSELLFYEEGIMGGERLQLVPLTISLVLVIWIMYKILHAMCKLFHKCLRCVSSLAKSASTL